MGVTEKKLYKQYQKMLKDMNIKQFTDEEYQEAIKNFKERSNEDE